MEGYLREKESEYLERFHLRELAEAWLANVANEMPADPYASLISAARWQREHGGGVVTCPNKWCKATMPASEFHVHSVFCNHESNWTRCSRCNGRVAISQLESHQLHCHITSCPLCGESVLPRLLCFCPYKLLQQTERDRLAHCIELPTRFSHMFEQSPNTNTNSQNNHNVEYSDNGTQFIENGATFNHTNTYPNDKHSETTEVTHSSVKTDHHKCEYAEPISVQELEEWEETITKKKERRPLSVDISQEEERGQDEELPDVRDKSTLRDSSQHLHQEEIAKSNTNSKSNTTPVFSSVENVRQSSWWRALSKRVLSHNRRTHSPVAFHSLSSFSSLATNTNALARKNGEATGEEGDTLVVSTENEDELLIKDVSMVEANDMLSPVPIHTLSNRKWTKRQDKYRGNRITLEKEHETQIKNKFMLELPSPELKQEVNPVIIVTNDNSKKQTKEVKIEKDNNIYNINDNNNNINFKYTGKDECEIINDNLDLIEDELECHSPIFKATRFDKHHKHMSHLPQFGILVNTPRSEFSSPLFDDNNKSELKFMGSPLSSLNTTGSTVVFTRSNKDSYSDCKEHYNRNNKNENEVCSGVMNSLSRISSIYTNDERRNKDDNNFNIVANSHPYSSNDKIETQEQLENKECMTSMTLSPEHISLLTHYSEHDTPFAQALNSLKAIQITWKKFTVVQNYRQVLFRAIWFNLEQAYERRATAQSISLSQLTSQITLEWTRMQEAKLKETRKELLKKQQEQQQQEQLQKEENTDINSNNENITYSGNNNQNNVLSDKHEINEVIELWPQEDECTDIEVNDVANDKGAFMSVSSLEKLTALNKRRAHLPLPLVLRIIHAATLILRARPVIQHVTIPTRGQVIVVGDLHGQLKDLFHILHTMGRPNHVRYYVFNGDFLDRGPYGCEVIVHLYALMCTFPEFVYLNRGNHEDCKTNHEYGLIQELYTKYTIHAAMVHDALVESYTELPLITLLDHRICVVHGGVPRNECTLERIAQLGKQRDIPVSVQHNASELLLADLLWNDPVEKFRSRRLGAQHSGPGWRSSKRGCGVEYLPSITHKFLKKNKLDLIVRSHEVVLAGFELLHHNKSITVFSASNYGGISGNRGAVAVFVKNTTLPKFNTWFIKEDVEARQAMARRLHKPPPLRQELQELSQKVLEEAKEKSENENTEESEQVMRRSSSPAYCSTTCVEIQTNSGNEENRDNDKSESKELHAKQSLQEEHEQDTSKCELLLSANVPKENVPCNSHAANFNVAVLLEEDALFAGDEYILNCFGNCFVDVDTYLLTELSQTAHHIDYTNNHNYLYLTSNEWSTGQNTPSVFSPSPPSSPESSQYIHTHSTLPSHSSSLPSSEVNVSLTNSHVHIPRDESICHNTNSDKANMEMKNGCSMHTEHSLDNKGKINNTSHVLQYESSSSKESSLKHQITNSCWQNNVSFWGQLRLGRDATSTLLQLRTISDIREHIYLNRYTLMIEFNDQDEDCDGAIYKPEWATILHDVLQIDLPWYYLCHFIYCPFASIGCDGCNDMNTKTEHVTLIQYARFLRHYDSLFAQRYMAEWQFALIKRVFETVDLPEDIIAIFDSRMSDFNTSTSTMSTRNNSCANSMHDESMNGINKNNEEKISRKSCTSENNVNNDNNIFINTKKESPLALEESEEVINIETINESDRNNNLHYIETTKENTSQSILNKSTSSDIRYKNTNSSTTCFVPVLLPSSETSPPYKLFHRNKEGNEEEEYCHSEGAPWRDVLVSFKTFANKIRNLSPVLATMEDNLLYCLFAFFDSTFRGHITLGQLVDGVNDVLHSKRHHHHHRNHKHNIINEENNNNNNSNICSDSSDNENNEESCEGSNSDTEFGSSSLEIVEDGDINFSFGNDHERAPSAVHEQKEQSKETMNENHKETNKEKDSVSKLASPTINWFDAGEETEMCNVINTSQMCHDVSEAKEEEEKEKEHQTSSSYTSLLPNSQLVSQNRKLDHISEGVNNIENNNFTSNCSDVNNKMESPLQSDLPFILLTTPNASHAMRLSPEKPLNMVDNNHSLEDHKNESCSSQVCLPQHKMHGNDSVSSLKYCSSHAPSHMPVHFTESEKNLPYATVLPRLIKLYQANKKLYDEMMLVVFPFMTRLHEEMIGGDTHARMRAVFTALDTNQDGKLCWSEFAMLTSLLDDQLEMVLTKEQRQFAFHLVHDEAIRYLFQLRSRYVNHSETSTTESTHNIKYKKNEKEWSKVQTTDKEVDIYMRARTEEETLNGEEFITLSEFRALFSVLAINVHSTVSTNTTQTTLGISANTQRNTSNNNKERLSCQEEVNVQIKKCTDAIAATYNITTPLSSLAVHKEETNKLEMLPVPLSLTSPIKKVNNNELSKQLEEKKYKSEYKYEEILQDDLEINKEENVFKTIGLKRNKCFYNSHRSLRETCHNANNIQNEDSNVTSNNNDIASNKLVEVDVSKTSNTETATSKVVENHKNSTTSLQEVINQLISCYGAHTSLEDLKNKVDNVTFTDRPTENLNYSNNNNNINVDREQVKYNVIGDRSELIAPLYVDHHMNRPTNINSFISLPSSCLTEHSEEHKKTSEEWEEHHQDVIPTENKDTYSNLTVPSPRPPQTSSLTHEPKSSFLPSSPLSPNQHPHHDKDINKNMLFKVINTDVNYLSPPQASPSSQSNRHDTKSDNHHHHHHHHDKKHKHTHSSKHKHEHETRKQEMEKRYDDNCHHNEHNAEEKNLSCEKREKEEHTASPPPPPPSTKSNELSHTTNLHNKSNLELSFMSIDSNRVVRRTCSFSSVSTVQSTFSSSSPSSLLNNQYNLNLNSSSCCSSPCDSLHFGRHQFPDKMKTHTEWNDGKLNVSPKAEAHYESSVSSFNRVMKSVNLSMESISSMHNVESPLSMEPAGNFNNCVDNCNSTNVISNVNNNNHHHSHKYHIKRSHSPFTCKPIKVPNSLFQQGKKILSNINDNIEDTNCQNSTSTSIHNNSKNSNSSINQSKANKVNRNSVNIDNVNVSWDDGNKTNDLQRTLRNVRKTNEV